MAGRFAVGVLAVALIGLSWAVYAETPALTDEDVVRLYVTGTSEDELVRRIETSLVDFDLSQEMLDELKIAGLSPALIQAMIQRQAAMEPAIDTADPRTTPGARGIIVRLNPEWQADSTKPRATIQALDVLDPQLAQRLDLRDSDLPLTDLGITLFCRTADHVPDHWRSKSPLGRDFANAARHKMLVYVSGADTQPAGKLRNTLSKLARVPGEREALSDMQVLTLEIPDQLTAKLEPDVAHDLTLGITVRVGDRNYLTISDHLDGVVVDGESDTTVRAVLRGGNKNPLKAQVRFMKEPAPNGP